MLDLSLVSALGGLALAAVAPGALQGVVGAELFELACIFVWVFVESLLLSTIGTTPGKWLLKTRLVPAARVPLDYSRALERSFNVWWRGMGAGLPLVSFITLALARERLAKNGITSWDDEQGFSVTHERIGVARILAVGLLYLALSLLVSVPALDDLG